MSGEPSVAECEAAASNLKAILDKVQAAAAEAEKGPYFRGRKPELVAVSKTKHPLLVKACYDVGHRKFGENYIQELEAKSSKLAEQCPEIQWHFIGRIQSNKIKKIARVKNLHCVETISEKTHATSLNKEMEKLGSTVNVMVQVNTSDEEQKGGASASEALSLACFIKTNCPSLKLCGFMTIGSFEVSVGKGLNEEFDRLFKVREEFCRRENVPEADLDLSMGMSHDFETAIKQGSSYVRVGSSIFGARNYNIA